MDMCWDIRLDKIEQSIYCLCMTDRRYESQNPWISFKYNAHKNSLWMQLGEAFSKCQHLAGTPLPPGVERRLAQIYLAKGALASTAIEGNTLTEDEAQAILDDELKLPPSQEYLETELKNVAAALEAVDQSAVAASGFRVTPEWIQQQNRMVLAGLDLDPHVVPGQYSRRQMVVGTYKAAPPEDVDFLVRQLCDWLNNSWLKPLEDPKTPAEDRFALSFFAATLAHLYIAWIHPFGDGNGRTARLLECAILAHSGVVPWVSSNVLSDFYNRTRTKYYRKLDAASKQNDIDGFICYSAEGFVDMLRQQIDHVRGLQRRIAWTNYVHESFSKETTGKAKDRRRALVLAMPEDKVTLRKDIPGLTPYLATAYAGHEQKIISRDLSKLTELGLIRYTRRGYQPAIHIMDAFRPIAPEWAPDQGSTVSGEIWKLV